MTATVSGKFNSFASLGEAMGLKHKVIREKERKCENCGKPLRHVAGTNTWVCGYATLSDEKLADREYQVFTRCNNSSIAAD